MDPYDVAIPVRSDLPVAIPSYLRNPYLTHDTVAMIISYEVGSRRFYESRLGGRPHYGGGAGGVLIGFGYNLGSVTEATFRRHWGAHLPRQHTDRLARVVGHSAHASGRAHIEELVAGLEDIAIPWTAAMAVFEEAMIPDYVARVKRSLPNADRLPARSLGALVALAYNRGEGGFTRDGQRYVEMRAITRHMAALDFSAIPNELRAMKRLWGHVPQLQARREDEASLFEAGLREAGMVPAR